LIAKVVVDGALDAADVELATHVLQVKFVRSLLMLDRAYPSGRIATKMKTFFPSWHSFYGVCAPPGAARAFVAVSVPELCANRLDRDEEQVCQEVLHEEPAAHRDEEILQLQADEDFALATEYRLHGIDNNAVSNSGLVPVAVERPEHVFLLRFGSGNGEALRHNLLSGPQFRDCLAALARGGH